jgi:cytochrome P450
MIASAHAPADQTAAAQQELLAYLGDLADAKLANPQDDAISRLAAAWAAHEITRDQLTGGAFALLTGGHETTANLIALSTIALLQRPDQLQSIRTSEDDVFIANAIEELLRYIHVAQSGLRRIATRDFEIAGHLIEAGDGVILPGNLANRDPHAFGDGVDELDVARERPERGHVAFGFGIHQCLGQALVRVEMRVVLRTLYRRIPTLALAVPAEDIAWKHGNFYGVSELPVTW